MASSNTFGTFLQTFNSLEKSSRLETPSDPMRLVTKLAQSLSSSGDQAPVEKLIAEVNEPKTDVLGALFDGQDKGIFKVENIDDTLTARLTNIGKSLSGL